jgi:arylsulfatase A-like enzyme
MNRVNTVILTLGGLTSLHPLMAFKNVFFGQQPNIIIITCEDISPDLGCYGNKIIKTPHIDQLAKDGILYENAYSSAGVSAPSRCALITGMYANSIGGGAMRTSQKGLIEHDPYEVVTPASVRCYSELMRIAGYYCTNNSKTDYQFTAPESAWDENSKLAYWENRPANSPFFSIFNSMTTHESQISYRRNSPVSYKDSEVIVPPYFPDDAVIRRDIARNYSNITVMDREVGEIIEKLKQQGLYDDAIVIFYSDHGGPLARQKREIVISGTHVPLIIKLPKNQLAGSRVSDLVSFVDIPPTVLSMAGIKVPGYMQGQVFLGPKKVKPRTYIHAARDRMDTETDMVRMTRDKQFIYIRNFYPEKPYYQNIQFRINTLPSMKRMLELKQENKLDSLQMLWFSTSKAAEQLYVVSDDPHTLHDVANHPDYQKDLIRLRSENARWMKRIRDQGLRKDGSLKPERELVLEMWPGGQQPHVATPTIRIINGKCRLSCNTPGSSMVYQVNGKGLHSNHWILYTGKPIPVNTGDVLTVKANRIGYKSSSNSLKL